MNIVSDVHSLQLLMLCQLSKSAPNLLWTARGFLSDNPLHLAGNYQAMELVKISIRSLVEQSVRPSSSAGAQRFFRARWLGARL
jgi:hypothetical protein